MKTVAAALEIHPFMLSKWRKDARDGRLRGRVPKAPPPGPAREIAQFQALEARYAALREEHELLKKAIRFCSARQLDVTRAGFYAWRRRGESAHAKQARIVTREITRLFALHHERYGSPRIYRLLRRDGWSVSRRRVARLMRAAGLRAKAVCGYRAKANVHALYSRHPNRLWTTTVTKPNQVWVGDITYLKVAGTWRYLAIVMDRYSRRILAWSLTAQRSASVTCAVFARAARARPARGVIFHSDRGSEYMGAPLRTLLVQFGVLQSASVRGPGDNAHAESFFHSLKAEVTRGVTYDSQAALRDELVRYIRYYNTIRLHSGLDYQSPLAFERQAA